MNGDLDPKKLFREELGKSDKKDDEQGRIRNYGGIFKGPPNPAGEYQDTTGNFEQKDGRAYDRRQKNSYERPETEDFERSTGADFWKKPIGKAELIYSEKLDSDPRGRYVMDPKDNKYTKDPVENRTADTDKNEYEKDPALGEFVKKTGPAPYRTTFNQETPEPAEPEEYVPEIPDQAGYPIEKPDEFDGGYGLDIEGGIGLLERQPRGVRGTNKNYFTLLMVLLGIGILFLGAVIYFVSSLAGKEPVKGNGKLITATRYLAEFTSIDAGGAFDVDITARLPQRIEITADENIIPVIKTEVKDGILRVYTEKPYNQVNRVKVKIYVMALNNLTVSGASSVAAKNIYSDKITVNLSGAGNLRLYGMVQEFILNVSGAGRVQSEKLIANSAHVTISGAGTADVYAESLLDTVISGAGKLIYYGDPETIKQDISGAGSISRGNTASNSQIR